MTLLYLGRRYCPTCNRVLVLVAPPDLTELPCPKCGHETIKSSGKDSMDLNSSDD